MCVVVNIDVQLFQSQLLEKMIFFLLFLNINYFTFLQILLFEEIFYFYISFKRGPNYLLKCSMMFLKPLSDELVSDDYLNSRCNPTCF